MSALQIAAGIGQALFFLAYPFIVYFAYTRFETRGVGALLLVLYAAAFALRARGSSTELRALARRHVGLLAVIGVAIAAGSRALLLLLPALVSLYLLASFGWSLWRGPPMIERFARLVEDDLPDFTLPYCRKVTGLWCAFLAANAAVVAILAFAAPIRWWTLYTGLLFYLLLGALLGTEFAVRKLWFRYYDDGPVDRVFARLFPPERTANGRRSLAYVARRTARGAVSGLRAEH